MSEIISIPILELMEKTEQWLLNQGYKKNTLGVYKATWNKFRAYSSSPFYDRETAEKFLLRYFGVDANAIDQKLDMRMRHARRHMSALDEFLRTGEICRRKVRGITTIASLHQLFRRRGRNLRADRRKRKREKHDQQVYYAAVKFSCFSNQRGNSLEWQRCLFHECKRTG